VLNGFHHHVVGQVRYPFMFLITGLLAWTILHFWDLA